MKRTRQENDPTLDPIMYQKWTEPRVLLCGHAFDASYLHRFKTATADYKCPTCRAVSITSVPLYTDVVSPAGPSQGQNDSRGGPEASQSTPPRNQSVSMPDHLTSAPDNPLNLALLGGPPPSDGDGNVDDHDDDDDDPDSSSDSDDEDEDEQESSSDDENDSHSSPRPKGFPGVLDGSIRSALERARCRRHDIYMRCISGLYKLLSAKIYQLHVTSLFHESAESNRWMVWPFKELVRVGLLQNATDLVVLLTYDNARYCNHFRAEGIVLKMCVGGKRGTMPHTAIDVNQPPLDGFLRNPQNYNVYLRYTCCGPYDG